METTSPTWSIDADILGAADAGELFRVEGAEAYLLSRDDIICLIARVEAGEEGAAYGSDWILVRAESGAAARRVACARAFDYEPRPLDDLVAIVIMA